MKGTFSPFYNILIRRLGEPRYRTHTYDSHITLSSIQQATLTILCTHFLLIALRTADLFWNSPPSSATRPTAHPRTPHECFARHPRIMDLWARPLFAETRGFLHLRGDDGSSCIPAAAAHQTPPRPASAHPSPCLPRCRARPPRALVDPSVGGPGPGRALLAPIISIDPKYTSAGLRRPAVFARRPAVFACRSRGSHAHQVIKCTFRSQLPARPTARTSHALAVRFIRFRNRVNTHCHNAVGKYIHHRVVD